MKKTYLIMIMSAALLAGCDKADDDNGIRIVTDTMTAGITTRTSLASNGKDVNWSQGDVVHYYSSNQGTVSQFSVQHAGQTATLTLQRNSDDTFYDLLYCGTAENQLSTATENNMTIDNGVNYLQDGSFANAHLCVAHARPGDSHVLFKNATSLIKMQIDRTDIRLLVFTGNSGEILSGDVTVNPNSETPAAVYCNDKSGYLSLALSINGAGTYYLSAIPQTLNKGFTIRAYDSNYDYVGYMKYTKSTQLVVNDIKDLGVLDSRINTKEASMDLGLSVLWATCNVGAYSPEDCGNYYAWGETAEKANYAYSTGTYRTNVETLALTNDVAHQKMGGNWRMPTYSEMQELMDNTKVTWTWIDIYDQRHKLESGGYILTSKVAGYEGNSIFLPAAGYRFRDSLQNVGELYYRTSSADGGQVSSLYASKTAKELKDSNGQNNDNNTRYHGYSVRGVMPKQ